MPKNMCMEMKDIDETIKINVTTVRNYAMHKHKQCNMQINQMLHHVAHVDWCVQLTEIRIMILYMAYSSLYRNVCTING